MTKAVQQQIEQLLINTLQPTFLQVQDESHLHVGHPGAASGGGHYRVIIYCESLLHVNRLAQHRQINGILIDLFKQDIHALAIEVLDQPPTTSSR